MKDAEVGRHLLRNPARLARPKAPKPYQTESVKALSDEEVGALVSAVRGRAQAGDIVGKRDYALLLLYLATGLRMGEAIGLRGKDVHVGETLVLEYRAKGGDYRSREVREPQVKEALLDYLRAADRLHALKTHAPLWTRHDRAGRPGEALSSHCFAFVNLPQGGLSAPTCAFPTRTTSPVPDSTAQYGSPSAFVSTSVYDYASGLATSATDANGATTTLSYAADSGAVDPLDRLMSKSLLRRAVCRTM